MPALIVVVLIALASFPAHAQTTVTTGDMHLRAPDADLWKAQRRARFLLAVGAGLTVGSAFHVAWSAPNRRCGSGQVMKRSLYTAGFGGALGLTFGIGGGSWLAASSASKGNLRASEGQRWAAAGLSAGAFVLSSLITTAVWGVDSAGCST